MSRIIAAVAKPLYPCLLSLDYGLNRIWLRAAVCIFPVYRLLQARRNNVGRVCKVQALAMRVV